MKLMLTVAYDILKAKKTATLKQIYEAVKSEQKILWKERFPGKTIAQIDESKMGELFTYLTTDGRFIMVDSKTWGLVENYPFDDVKKMRINIGENKE